MIRKYPVTSEHSEKTGNQKMKYAGRDLIF